MLTLGHGFAAGVVFSMQYGPFDLLWLLLICLPVMLALLSIRWPMLLIGSAGFFASCWLATQMPTRLMDQRIAFAAASIAPQQLVGMLESSGWTVDQRGPVPARLLHLPSRNLRLKELNESLIAQRLAWLRPPGRCGFGLSYSLLWGAKDDDRLVLSWFRNATDDNADTHTATRP